MNKAQLQKIPRATITKVLTDSEVQCGVCLDTFNLNETEVRKLPCDHLYHSKCIFPWLKRKPSCPYCRAKLPNINRNIVRFGERLDSLETERIRMRAEILSSPTRMNWIRRQINMLEQHTLEDSRSPVSSTPASTNDAVSSMPANGNDDHSQIAQTGIIRGRILTPEEANSSAIRVRTAVAAIYARRARIYRRWIALRNRSTL